MSPVYSVGTQRRTMMMMMSSRAVFFACFLLLAVHEAALEERSASTDRRADRASSSQCAHRSEQFASYAGLCPPACSNTTVCPGKSRCECHYACGMVCIDTTIDTSCGTLQIENGKATIVPHNRLGALATYTCNPQYVLVGRTERVCMNSRSWTGNPPTCERVFCNQPPPIVNGRPILNETTRFTVGAEVEYQCDDGYVALGTFKVNCTSAGSWTRLQMACMPVSCGHPGAVQNSRMIGDMFVYGSTVLYYCDVGYSLVGAVMIKCLSSGQWSNKPPNCTAIDCGLLASPRNGYVVNGATRYNSIAEYRCVAGYQLRGPERRMCQLDGTWDGSEPTCELADCGRLPVLPNGLVTCASRIDGRCNTLFGAQVEFQCDQLSQMDANSATTAVCNARGEWEPEVPTCWRHCDLPNVVNGTLNLTAIASTVGTRDAVAIRHDDRLYIRNGSILRTEYVICSGGTEEYILANENRVVCSNGTFLKTPQCIPAPCRTRPSGVPFGMVRFTRMLHGYRARYSCHPGYQLKGIDTATCLFGRWIFPRNGQVPSCHELVCPSPRPRNFGNGIIYMVGINGKYEVQQHQTKFQHGDALEFVCNSNFTLFGTPYQTCVNGEWNPPNQPLCIYETCIPITHDMTKKVMMSMVAVNETYQLNLLVECRKGYAVSGDSNTATCINGAWFPAVPECLPKNCSAVSMLETLAVSPSNLPRYNFELRNKRAEKPALIGYEMNNEIRNNASAVYTQHGHTVEVSCRRSTTGKITMECAYGDWTVDNRITC